MSKYYVERTLKKDGSQSIVLVDKNYKIVKPVALFLDYLEKRGMAFNTIENYCRDLKEYFTWLSNEQLKFYEVNKRTMIGWVDYINNQVGNKEVKSARTVNRYLATIASFYNYFERFEGYIEENPVTAKLESNYFTQQIRRINKDTTNANLFRRKERKKVNTQRLFRNEIDLLYAGMSKLTGCKDINFRNQLIFRVLYETGCRIGEVLGLRIKDYSTPDPVDNIGFVFVRRHYPKYHNDHSIKTNERKIPVSMDLIYAIEDYVINVRPFKEAIETIFVNHAYATKGNFMTRSAVEKIFSKLSKEVDIKCTPHMLRHTHGTELRESGYNQIYISNRLGHSSIESTNKYMHISFEAQAEAYERFMTKRNGGTK